jgi:hypothetical protein
VCVCVCVCVRERKRGVVRCFSFSAARPCTGSVALAAGLIRDSACVLDD